MGKDLSFKVANLKMVQLINHMAKKTKQALKSSNVKNVVHDK